MKCTTVIDKDRDEEVLIYLKKPSTISRKVEELISAEAPELMGYGDKSIVRLDLFEVFCFTVEDGKVYALTKDDKLILRQRLYTLEEMCGEDFVKINQSCIVNTKSILKFDTSLGGSLMVTLKNGYRDYVSRRQLRTVKERLGF